MQKIIKGKVYVLDDNIDTDQIIPAEHLVYSLSVPEEVKMYGHFALSGVPPRKAGLPQGNIPFIEGENHRSQFNIIVAGSNFGCGSSREHAPFALQVAGVQVVVAESYARIFYRNSVDGGFIIPLESVGKINDQFKTGDEVQVDIDRRQITNLTTGKSFALKHPGDVLPIIEAGGLFEYARKSGMI
ncbi:3-isopropylmalate dehydratase [candidate division KSB1 bacterium]|jgi:3-isopropylmalate/(R)-2-methylmalate dehydratase small subunit|nr:MAG: 3-isopropylmalate dehydratase [candidate division KSB1 bacterium]